MHVNEFLKQENREALASELTKEGLFELTEETIRGNKYNVFVSAPKNLHDYFQFATIHGEWDFLAYEDESYSYQEVLKMAAGFAHTLINDYGVKKGDSVAFSMRNYPEWMFSYMAVTSIGAIAVPLNSWWQGEELDYGITHSESKLFIGDDERLERLKGFVENIPRIAVRCEASNYVNTKNFQDIVKPNDSFPEVDVDPEDDASIMYTSGSTGYPKGVVATHRSIINTPLAWAFLATLAGSLETDGDAQTFPQPEKPCTLAAVPLFHVTGSHSNFLLSLLSATKIVLMYKWDPLNALRLVEKHQVSSFSGVPTMSEDILRTSRENPDIDVSSLAMLNGGGAARPPEQIKAQERDHPTKVAGVGYGLTETNAAGTNASGKLLYTKPSTAGFPTPLIHEVKIIDEEGSELATGDQGEVCIRSASNFRCYWKNEEATKESLSSDGWFRSGDVGYLDEDGFLFIKDRIKDIVIRGGENIACLEIEAVLAEHPAISEASVFGVPDERLGESLATRIALEPGQTVTEAEVSSFLEEKIAKFKIPSHMWIQEEELPRIASGKTAKKLMREEAIKELGLES
ncbi:MAG: long-chain fatty acid--CoA ligase [Chloroflexi bacterium]|nr:long-chain fatty acid--CoA ligase [Chloroflexota bacterium]